MHYILETISSASALLFFGQLPTSDYSLGLARAGARNIYILVPIRILGWAELSIAVLIILHIIYCIVILPRV